MEQVDINGTLRTLSDSQRTAIDAIVSGATHEGAATAAGVCRGTVSRWCNHHPEFQAELNRRRLEIEVQRLDLIRQIDRLFLEQIRKGIEDGDPTFIANWIKARGFSNINTSVIGPCSSEEIIAAEVEKRYQEVSADFSEMKAEITEERANGGLSLLPHRPSIQATIEDELQNLNECAPEPPWDSRE